MLLIKLSCLLSVMSLSGAQKTVRSNYVPVLVWTGADVKVGPALPLNKVECDLFSLYLAVKVGGIDADIPRPLVLVFTEEFLSEEDFNLKDAQGYSVYPFISNITQKLDLFESVATPLQAISTLTKLNYTLISLSPRSAAKKDVRATPPSVLSVDMGMVKGGRGGGLRKHDEVIQKIMKNVMNERKDWIAIYTGKFGKEIESPKKRETNVSSWHISPTPYLYPSSSVALHLFQDALAHVAFLSTSPLMLSLPSTQGDVFMIPLYDHNAATAFFSKQNLEFIIWFENYTVNLHGIASGNKTWSIDFIDVENMKGERLKLVKTPKVTGSSQSAATVFTWFQSEVPPNVKMRVGRYLFTQLDPEARMCKAVLGPLRLSLMIFLALVLGVASGHIILKLMFLNKPHAKIYEFPFPYQIKTKLNTDTQHLLMCK